MHPWVFFFNLQETYYHYTENGRPANIAFLDTQRRSIQYGDKSSGKKYTNYLPMKNQVVVFKKKVVETELSYKWTI